MSNLVYLLLAVTLSLMGSLWVWYRHRRPRSTEDRIDEFQRELRALAPDQAPTSSAWVRPPSDRSPDERSR